MPKSRPAKTSNVEPVGTDAVEDIREAVAALTREDRRRSKQEKVQAQTEIQAQTAPASDPEQTTSEDTDPDPNLSDALRRAEAVLFAAAEPVSAETLAQALPPGADVARTLMELKQTYAGRGVQLVEIAGKWRFQTASDLGFLFEETREEERKLSRAAMETLSIIAYCQPVTRAEIEDVRGVAVSRGTLDVLMELDWVRGRGRRRSPGRPVTYGVTDAFLEHFGLDSLDSLPGLEEMKAAGLLSSAIPDDFDMPRPSDSEADEDLIEDISEDPHAREDGAFVTDFMTDSDD